MCAFLYFLIIFYIIDWLKLNILRSIVLSSKLITFYFVTNFWNLYVCIHYYTYIVKVQKNIYVVTVGFRQATVYSFLAVYFGKAFEHAFES